MLSSGLGITNSVGDCSIGRIARDAGVAGDVAVFASLPKVLTHGGHRQCLSPCRHFQGDDTFLELVGAVDGRAVSTVDFDIYDHDNLDGRHIEEDEQMVRQKCY
jgi:hypothetical protein